MVISNIWANLLFLFSYNHEKGSLSSRGQTADVTEFNKVFLTRSPTIREVSKFKACFTR